MKEHYDLVELLELARKYHATHIKLGNLEIQLSPTAFAEAPASQGPVAPPPEHFGPGVLSEDDFLFYSTIQGPATPEREGGK